MQKIKVMVNGIPGNIAVNIAKHVMEDNRFVLIPQSLTGPEITDTEYHIHSLSINLIQPEKRDSKITQIKKAEGSFITVDFTHPSAVNSNAEFYCSHNLPFVMGTTGGDREKLEKTVLGASVPAVIAPNMAKQIVGFQAMMEYAAITFPGLFKNYSLQIKESHQRGKADTSGTAKAMIKYFDLLGVSFSENNIEMERDPGIQKSQWGIPEEYLSGHGWHTYILTSQDKTVCFEFKHNVNGRDVYAHGTLDAVSYLAGKIDEDAGANVYNMIDVLKGI